MKKISKITALILSMLMVFSNALIFASETENETVPPQQPLPFYFSFTGIVKEIENNNDGMIKVFIESKDGSPATFVLTESTYYVDDVKIEKGKEITGYYESGKPMILIYPPQYSIDIVSPVFTDTNVKADKFNDDLLSKDKTLKLNISEDTEILWENGTVMNWFVKPSLSDLQLALSNRKMIVFYDFTTKSIPAQTTPNKIIVLSQQEFDKINIIVNDAIIEAPTAYENEDGVLMVPIRAISEALGYEVLWNNENRSIQIGKDISIKVGENNYNVSNNALLQLETAPIINNDKTYIPLSFFKEAANINVVSFFENNVIIQNGRTMN